MKYSSYLAALAVLFTAACAKEEIADKQQPVLPEDAVSFSGAMEQGGQKGTSSVTTRTSYEDTEETIVVRWSGKDNIGVFCETEGETVAANVAYTNGTPGLTAAFDAVDADNVIRKDEDGRAQDFYAYYPYAAGEGVPVTAVPVVLPSEQTFSNADEQFLLKLNSYIVNNLDNPAFGVHSITVEMGMSRASLYSKIKALTDLGVNDYVNRIRIEQAMILLEKSDMTIAEVSERVGFSTPAYFSTSFKHFTTLSPSAYKNIKQHKT